jgi:hypothetical protein
MDNPIKLDFANKHNIAEGASDAERTDEAMEYIFQRSTDRRLSLIYYRLSDDGVRRMPASLIVIGSNRSKDELRSAQNPERIQKYQEILGTAERPQWFNPIG